MAYKTIHTKHGRVAIAQAQATGVPINLTHMAVGDGGGVAAEPNPLQTALVNERHRSTINAVRQDPSDPTLYYVELVIPAAIGGWWIREFGIFDDDGKLFAVGSFPDAYKPLPSDGATHDMVVRVNLVVTEVGVITLQIDPSVTIASRQWVLQTVTPAALWPGGTTNQVLTKNSNLDGDAEWKDPGSGTVIVNAVEETQVITANPQLTLNLVTATTLGLSVYVEGIRIPRKAGADGWQQGVDNTQVVLGKQYPIGSLVHFVQNDPMASFPQMLEASKNLTDVPDKAAARAALDVHTKAESDAAGQPGDIKYSARSTAPAGWLKANGAAVSRTTYAALFLAIGTTYGAGDGVNTFNLPDLRGEFIRGWDDGRGVDPGRAFGSLQLDAFQGHEHQFFDLRNGGGGGYNGAGANDWTRNTQAIVQKGGFSAPRVADETRPRSVALLPLIKF